MALLHAGLGFVGGVVVGVGGFLLYMQYRTRKQLAQMEQAFGELGAEDLGMPEDMDMESASPE